jgi:hypothetical protein
MQRDKNILSVMMATLFAASRSSYRQYRFQPYTTRDIGKRVGVRRSKYMPHQGERECARRRRQLTSA